MSFKKWICALITIALAIAVSCSVYAAAEASQASLLQATANVNIRTGPGTDYGKTGTLIAGETATYLGEISIDNRGVAWYNILFNGEDGWVSAKYSRLLSEPATIEIQSPLADYPHFYDGYIFELTGIMQYKDNSDEPANGCNANGDMVNWVIDAYCVEQDPENGGYKVCPPPELAYCSWTSGWISVSDAGLPRAWTLVAQKKTAADTNLYYHWPDDQELRTYTTCLYLPDDPEIEGEQRIIYYAGEEALVFDFYLDYDGGYSGYGMGWKMRDVKFSRCDRSEFESVPEQKPEQASPMADYAHYYDGYVFEMSALMQYKDNSDEPANGCNANGDMVNWLIDVYCVEQDPENGGYKVCPPPELTFCSWAESWTSFPDASLHEPWRLANEGKTSTMTGLYYHWPDDQEIRTYSNYLFLPDDPGIEGHQRVVYLMEQDMIIFDFTLDYIGGYSGNGYGWEMRNVECIISRRTDQ